MYMFFESSKLSYKPTKNGIFDSVAIFYVSISLCNAVCK